MADSERSHEGMFEATRSDIAGKRQVLRGRPQQDWVWQEEIMQIAVLGGNGFIGSNLVQELVGRQHQVRVFDRPNVASPLPPEICRHVEWMAGDLADEASLQSALNGVETVFHLISTTLAQSSTDNPAYDVETNVVSTIRMLEVAKSQGSGRLFSCPLVERSMAFRDASPSTRSIPAIQSPPTASRS